ncbi:MAG: ParB N-terminal domain-containing protein [Verrucomicrobiota bacterium]|jgi:ParB-like chromosome segregation protein Spo0J
MSILPGSCDTITIDEEFRAHCPPLTETERQMLRQDIERTGLLSPLIVWNHEGKTILVDGHNRYEILQELGRLDEIQTTELVFDTRENALDWIINNQLGRRNLPPDAAALLRGKLYTAERIPAKERLFKPGVSANPGGVPKTEDCHSGSPETIADAIAKKTGVSARTIARDAKFAEAVEKLGITKEVMAGTEKRTRKEIIEAAFPPLPTLKRERPLEDILAQRWEPFIKDIPFNRHRDVYQWITRTLNQPRW